jgi:hypothetical protein
MRPIQEINSTVTIKPIKAVKAITTKRVGEVIDTAVTYISSGKLAIVDTQYLTKGGRYVFTVTYADNCTECFFAQIDRGCAPAPITVSTTANCGSPHCSNQIC